MIPGEPCLQKLARNGQWFMRDATTICRIEVEFEPIPLDPRHASVIVLPGRLGHIPRGLPV